MGYAAGRMQTLREKLFESSRFLVGTELVSVRGGMAERSAIKARDFANELAASPDIDWISITDNAGGNPQLAPLTLGRPILYAGKEVAIHLTCKDLNRNGLESEAWMLHSEGFHNILAMTGDYPVAGNEGLAKPVFDIDSVGLISMLNKMNHGLDPKNGRDKNQRLAKTDFLIGAVTTNFKLREGEVMPQYAKLEKKIQCGAQFIINQIGFDSRKISELRFYMDARRLGKTPLIGNVYLFSSMVAQIFSEGKIPGVVVTKPLLDLCLKHGDSADGGKAFFYEFAAKQMAIYRGLGFRGVYLGGVHNFPAIQKILEIEKSFAPDDWKQFAREIKFSQPGEFFYFAENPKTGLADPTKRNPDSSVSSKHITATYQLSKWTHDHFFAPETKFAKFGAKICERADDSFQGPKPLRVLEKLSKSALFHCKDCGDCSLPDIAFLCPESQCAKNQRNGPCGGTREGRCEVDGFGDCIWLRAYERLKHDGRENELLKHAPVVQNQGLRGTSAWANNWLGRDHTAKNKNEEKIG
ncbi:MAG TPA: methylenetetrahydrofolate reductase C-terminal domain-containing protein [Verrucomicrobiae bacterium]|nr:methylenetetrahydrofolate reductase C-terminal domain-containing protein [Verrucomicrobiae bacterium]